MGTDRWFKSLAGVELDNYTLEEYIDSGKIAHVYKARSKEMPDWVVVIPGSLQHGWQNEIKKAFLLSGIAGVVHFHGLGNGRASINGRTEVFLYTVWDYIPPARNLRNYLKAIDSCPASFLVAVIEQILRVLHACEKKGVKHHGDLHLGNILIGEKDEADLDVDLGTREPIFVSDFGFGATGEAKTPKDDYEGLAVERKSSIRETSTH